MPPAKTSKKRSREQMYATGALRLEEPVADKRFKMEVDPETYLRAQQLEQISRLPPKQARVKKVKPDPRWRRRNISALERRRIIELSFGGMGRTEPRL